MDVAQFQKVFSPTKEKAVFWTKEKICGHTHFNIKSQDKFWDDYIELVQQYVPDVHIQYGNNNPDYKSGLTIDNDIIFEIDKRKYITQSRKCREHSEKEQFNIEFLSCDDCMKLARELDKRLKDDKIDIVFESAIQKFPYRPSLQEITAIQELNAELQLFLKEHFQVNDEQLEYVILIRDNINLKKLQEEGIIRYGFHTYFFNFKCSYQCKKFIKEKFKLSKQLQERMLLLWPKSTMDEIFDLQPLTGSTSLPIASPPEKRYSFYYDEDNNDFVNIFEQPDILQALNPFGGKEIVLLPQFITVNLNDTDLLRYVQEKNLTSYPNAIYHILNECKEIVQFTSNVQFRQLLTTYNHPSFDKRRDIVMALYNLIPKNHDIKRIIFRVQLLFFLIMCDEYETLEERKNQVVVNWYQNSNQFRYPYQISNFVKEQLRVPKEMAEPYMKLIQDYNKYKSEIVPDFEKLDTSEIQSFSYQNFIQFISEYKKGIYGGDQLFLTLKNRQLNPTVNDIFNNYILKQIQQNLVVTGTTDCYIYSPWIESFDGSYDFDKYHLVEENFIEAKCMNIVQKIKDGIDVQIHKHQQEGKIQKIAIDDMLLNFYEIYVGIQKGLIKPIVKGCLVIDQDAFNYFCMYVNYEILSSRLSQYQESMIGKNFSKTILTKTLSQQRIKFPIDQQQNIIGVYNGIIEYLPKEDQCRFYSGEESKQYIISKSTLFNIREDFLTKDMTLVTPNELPQHLKEIYNKIVQIASDIYDDDIDVLEWKIYQILHKMFSKISTGENLFIAFGTGSDGKTTMMQAICNAIGSQGLGVQSEDKSRRIKTSGYSAKAKSTILQTSQGKAGSHDTGGLSELKGNFFCLCTELNQSEPIVASMIKTLLCGTSISARQIYGKDTDTFTNKCFIELQTNYYPQFDQSMDTGLMRRVLFYRHKIKFVSQAKYDTLVEEQRKFYRVGNPEIQRMLLNNFDFIDVLGFYMLWIFLTYKNRDPAYIPEKLTRHTHQFFNTSCQYLAQCLNLLEVDNGSMVHYTYYTQEITQLVLKKDKTTRSNKQNMVDDHIQRIYSVFQKNIFAININTGEEKQVTENDLQQIVSDQNYIVLIKNHKFRSEETQKVNNDRLIDGGLSI